MLQVNNLSKRYSARTLFEGVTFSMTRGERLALIGRNGCGKSTIFRMLTEHEHPDEGSINVPRGYRIGHLPQHLHFTEENIVKEVCLGLHEDERDQEYRAEILLSGLGFSEAEMQQPASNFSGGFQIRVVLAQVLVSEPNLLLLDEPTNYLDIVSMRWLTHFLRDWQNEVIIISHDRTFLDEVCTHTMLIHRKGIRKIKGNTEKLYEDIAMQDEVYEKTKINEDKRRKDVEVFINRFRAQASKAKAVQSRIKALERMGTKEDIQEEEALDFKFSETNTFYGRSMLEATEVSFKYEEGKPLLINNLSVTIAPGDRIGIIGKNGKGKSTLLKVFADELKPTHGAVTRNQNTRFGYFGQTNIARLNPLNTVEDEIYSVNRMLSKTRVRGICGTMMFSGDEALKKISVLSGGEKSRVLLGKILAEQTNLLFLDEPTNHLDMESIDALSEAAQEYQGAIVVVTHSEDLLRSLCTRLIVFQGEEPFLVEGNYDYFLSTIGWEEEEALLPSSQRKKNKQAAVKPADDRAARAEQVKERSKLVKPLQQKISEIENQITALEKKVKEDETQLIAASSSGNKGTIATLSKQLAENQSTIERLFTELEKTSKELEAVA